MVCRLLFTDWLNMTKDEIDRAKWQLANYLAQAFTKFEADTGFKVVGADVEHVTCQYIESPTEFTLIKSVNIKLESV